MKTLTLKFQALIWLVLPLLLIMGSCKKQDEWLDKKSGNNQVVPTTLQDFQAVLDNNTVFNEQGSVMGLIASDNLLIKDTDLDAEEETNRNAYLWAKDIYRGGAAYDWSYKYTCIAYANIVLEGLDKLAEDENALNYRNVKGSALFYRAYSFYQLCELYCKPYRSSTASADLGIPLRTSPDVNLKVQRASVAESYARIIEDLKTALALLPDVPQYRTRPSAVAVNALLARVYLSMRDHANALRYADAALQKAGALLDYNTLPVSTANPFPAFAKGNPEVIFYESALGYSPTLSIPGVTSRISPAVYQSYANEDLRKTAFYLADGTTGLFKFKGSYAATAYCFSGLATNELYLIRAECEARNGSLSSALADLNLLLKNRYATAVFAPYATTDLTALLERILVERRKELPYTGNIRWTDLKRLNQETQFAQILTRTVRNNTYQLPPNDDRYVFPIPDSDIQLGGLIQNSR